MRPGARGRLGAVLLPVSVLVPLGATPEDPPAEPAPVVHEYRQVQPCVTEIGSARPVEQAVSWAQRRLTFPQLWSLSQGEGVTVAVVDTGVNPTAAFGDRLAAGGDLVAAWEGTAGLADCDGHGTMVAGIIAAQVDPVTGFGGVAPKARILSIRQNSAAYRPTDPDDERESAGDADSMAEAVRIAVAAGADVINISAAQCGPAGYVHSPDLESAVNEAVAADVVVVAAAGNLGTSPACRAQNSPAEPIRTTALPAAIPATLTVGSVDPDGRPSQFSLAGPWVDIAAPGSDLITVNPDGATGGQVDLSVGRHGVGEIAGTSFAAPYVTGVVALVRARYPHLSAEQVVQRVLVTANPPAHGTDIAVGHGEINPARALTAVIDGEDGRPHRSAGWPRSSVEAPAAPAAPPGWHVTQLISVAVLAGLAGAGIVRAALSVPRRTEA